MIPVSKILFSIHLGTDSTTGEAVGHKPEAKNVALNFFCNFKYIARLEGKGLDEW